MNDNYVSLINVTWYFYINLGFKISLRCTETTVGTYLEIGIKCQSLLGNWLKLKLNILPNTSLIYSLIYSDLRFGKSIRKLPFLLLWMHIVFIILHLNLRQRKVIPSDRDKKKKKNNLNLVLLNYSLN